MTSTTRAESFYLNQDGPALNAAWAALAGYLIGTGLGDGTDVVQRNVETGECWQYMGSRRTESGQVSHDFRHRDHPKTRWRVTPCLPVPAPYPQ